LLASFILLSSLTAQSLKVNTQKVESLNSFHIPSLALSGSHSVYITYSEFTASLRKVLMCECKI